VIYKKKNGERKRARKSRGQKKGKGEGKGGEVGKKTNTRLTGCLQGGEVRGKNGWTCLIVSGV